MPPPQYAGLAGMLPGMTYERDPLSVRYDGAAARFITRVLAAWDGGRDGRWAQTAVAPPSERVTAWAMRRGIDPLMLRYTGQRSGVETLHEAAFRRACYHDMRVYLWALPSPHVQVRNPERLAALEFRWRGRTSAGRIAEARAHPVRSASRYAARNDPYGRMK